MTGLEPLTARSAAAASCTPHFLALAVLAMPPTSIEPPPKQQVVITHLHRRVRACTAVPSAKPTSCAPQPTDASAKTSVFLAPVGVMSGISASTQRVAVTLPDKPGLQRQAVALAVGDWTVEWPGCRELGRLSVSTATGVAPRVSLRTTSGGCELADSRCELISGAREQVLTIEP